MAMIIKTTSMFGRFARRFQEARMEQALREVNRHRQFLNVKAR